MSAGLAEERVETSKYVWCTCSYYELDFENQITIVRGTKCSIHPNGCLHGCKWHEPCQACFEDGQGPTPEGQKMMGLVDKIETLSSAAYHQFGHVNKFAQGMTALREIAALANEAIAAYDAVKR